MILFLKVQLSAIQAFLEKNKLELLFISFIIFTLYKFLGLLSLNIYIRLSFCLAAGAIFFFKRSFLIPFFFQFTFTQAFLFFCLYLDNLIFSSFIFSFFFSSILFYNLVSNEHSFLIASCLLFLYSIYSAFRNLIFQSDLIEAGHPLEKLNKAEDLDWDKILKTFKFYMHKLYGHNYVDRLPDTFRKIAFPSVAKRYMFKRILAQIELYPTALTFIGQTALGVGAGIGAVAAYHHQEKAHQLEVEKLSIEVEKLSIEVEKLSIEKNNSLANNVTTVMSKVEEVNSNQAKILLEVADRYERLGDKKKALESISEAKNIVRDKLTPNEAKEFLNVFAVPSLAEVGEFQTKLKNKSEDLVPCSLEFSFSAYLIQIVNYLFSFF